MRQPRHCALFYMNGCVNVFTIFTRSSLHAPKEIYLDGIFFSFHFLLFCCSQKWVMGVHNCNDGVRTSSLLCWLDAGHYAVVTSQWHTVQSVLSLCPQVHAWLVILLLCVEKSFSPFVIGRSVSLFLRCFFSVLPQRFLLLVILRCM